MEKAFRASGVAEGPARQASELLDFLVEGAREYARAELAKPGRALSSTPNPVAPLIDIALNLETITCASTLVAIRSVQTDLTVRLAVEGRGTTVEEAALWNRLWNLTNALLGACDDSDLPDGESARATSLGMIPDVKFDAVLDAYPPDWTFDDFACLRSCVPAYERYLARAESILPGTAFATRVDRARFDRLSGERLAVLDQPAACAEAGVRLSIHIVRMQENLTTARDNIARLDRFYVDQVIGCLKRCDVRVQLPAGREFPETPDHVELRTALLSGPRPEGDVICAAPEPIGGPVPSAVIPFQPPRPPGN